MMSIIVNKLRGHNLEQIYTLLLTDDEQEFELLIPREKYI